MDWLNLVIPQSSPGAVICYAVPVCIGSMLPIFSWSTPVLEDEVRVIGDGHLTVPVVSWMGWCGSCVGAVGIISAIELLDGLQGSTPGWSSGGGPCVCHWLMAGRIDHAICKCLCLISCRISPKIPYPCQYFSLRQSV